MGTHPSLTSGIQHSTLSERAAWSTGLASLRERLNAMCDLVAVWRERIYYRGELKRLAADGPQRIDDVGLTLAGVEAELHKRFWEA
jgi:uncharacterized protein YjiS (DUF1127 family)